MRDKIVAEVLAAILVAAVLVGLRMNVMDTPVVDSGDLVQVANIYNLPKDRGLQYLADQGFTSITINVVCSNSVDAGRIREVILDDHPSANNKTVLVGPTGPKDIKVPLSTKLLVKVSNGKACPT